MNKISNALIAVMFLSACPDAPQDDQMTIIVREDSKRITEEKNRLAEERQKIESLKAELDQAEQSIRKISSNPGDKQNKDDLQAVLANLKKLRRQQENIFRQRSKSLDEREKALQQKQNLIETQAKATPNTNAPKATVKQSQEIEALRQGQNKLNRQLGEVQTSLAAIQKQLTFIAGKINSAPVIAAPVAPVANRSGAPVKRSLVNKRYRRARKQLRAKGLLMEDLPPSYQGHNAAIRKALKSGDTSLANDLVSQLLQVIKQVKIDGPFINAKLARIAARMKRSSLDSSRKAKVNTLFQATTRDVTDGKFSRANRKLNELAALLVD